MTNLILKQAAKKVTTKYDISLASEQVVSSLLEAEKFAKQNKVNYAFNQLIGTWRLCFITGTKKSRARAGVLLGAGQYIPKFIKITISYKATKLESEFEAGTVENCVEFGMLKLIVSGVTKFLNKKNILAFDFTRMTIQLFGTTLYSGYIRGGEKKEQEFYAESVKKQAFFSYFLVEHEIIAARGRGGGLALWSKQE